MLGKAVSIGGREGEGGVEGMSTTTAALVVVGVAGVVAEDCCSRSRWRREWCLSPQWRHENLLGQVRQPCLSEKQFRHRRRSLTSLFRFSTSNTTNVAQRLSWCISLQAMHLRLGLGRGGRLADGWDGEGDGEDEGQGGCAEVAEDEEDLEEATNDGESEGIM